LVFIGKSNFPFVQSPTKPPIETEAAPEFGGMSSDAVRRRSIQRPAPPAGPERPSCGRLPGNNGHRPARGRAGHRRTTGNGMSPSAGGAEWPWPACGGCRCSRSSHRFASRRESRCRFPRSRGGAGQVRA
jgi:hypothetical protein